MIGSLFILPTIASYHFFKDYFGNETKNLDLLVDHSRFGTNNYGLEWGAITDELVREYYYINMRLFTHFNIRLKQNLKPEI